MTENPPNEHSALYERIGRLRWQVAVLALVLVLVHQWIEHAYLFFLPKWTHFGTQVLFYGLGGPTLAWLALSSLRNQVAETDQAERAVRRSRDELAEVNRRLEFLVAVERRLAEAEDEEELFGAILELPLEVVPALGVSLLRLDEEGNPLPAVHYGELSPSEFERWSRHLATEEASQACEACTAKRASSEVPCPTLQGAPQALKAKRVHCLELTRGDREFGILSIYLQTDVHPTLEEQGLLEVMASSMSLALESQLLRAKELGTLYQLQRIHQLRGLEPQLREVVLSTMRALELDGGATFLVEGGGDLRASVVEQEGEGPAPEFLLAMASAVRQSEAPLVAGSLELTPRTEEGARSLVVAPLRKKGEWLGSLLFWSTEGEAFASRQVRIVESVASQAALLVENHRLYREVEYRAGLAERARLAREIHDGLAQTLGYLKLKANQATRWLEQGLTDRIAESIADIKDQLDKAYVDAREAIDGLRIEPGEGRFESWLQEVCAEFESMTEIQVRAAPQPEIELPAEVQSQLLRIIQEALGNVRKHAAASHVWVDWQADDHWIVLRVRDDGSGFDPAGLPPISRHGLRIMRERAELLGADFQLVSREGEGTEVLVRLPLQALNRSGSHG